MHVVATAGHVDHGKSSLVRALTGTDPDRWDEEKRRGMTIDLGFAFLRLPSGSDVGFVDVPGHVRFLKNMLAGVGAVHAAMLVVAATEGWMPQTEEHLRILELLGIDRGLTVITMADLVDNDTLETVELDVLERIGPTFLGASPVLVCDSMSGRGLAGLVEAIDTVVDAVTDGAAPPVDGGRPRLWVDRAFSAHGSGTVVTGTLGGGSLRRGDEVLIAPGGRQARVRTIQSGHAEVEVAVSGARVALNLSGVARGAIARGDAVITDGHWILTDTVDAAVTMLDAHALSRTTRLKAYIGSGEHDALVRPLAEGFVRIRVEAALPITPGDRVVLRDPGREMTVGGAEVLDVAPPKRAKANPNRLTLPPIERVLAVEPVVEFVDLPRLTGLDRSVVESVVDAMAAAGAVVKVGSVLADAEIVEKVRAATRGALDDGSRRAGGEARAALATVAARVQLDLPVLTRLLACLPEFRVTGTEVSRAGPGEDPAADPGARAFLVALETAPFSPPSPREAGVDMGTVRGLVRAGAVIETEGMYFARVAYTAAVDAVTAAITQHGDLTVGEVRDVLGSSRKHVVPLLKQMDRDGITRRNGDRRALGPRAPNGPSAASSN